VWFDSKLIQLKQYILRYILLPHSPILNRDLPGLDQAEIVNLEQEIQNLNMSGMDQADIDIIEQEIRSNWGHPTMKK
jgi:hypothetical protein